MMRRIRCAEIWGGIRNCDEDILTSGITASLYSAAADGGRGGDIYYFSVCSSDRLTRIALADVVGHGEKVSVTSQWMYHALAERMNLFDGNGILHHLNHLSDEYGFDATTTAAVIGYNTANSELYFAYAGHPPVLVQRQSNRRWEPVSFANPSHTGNLPFGVDVEALYDQERVPLSAGDRLFLYTDGVIEAPDRQGRLFRLGSLLAILEETGGRSLPQIKTAVREQLMKHTGGPLSHDDVTFMVIEIL
jgi:sigma-B regulation protein RsbU (phosphoserine phosphatase)